jgi:hypothetical protein
MSSSDLIIEYAKSTQNVCLCVAISSVLLIIIMVLPINKLIGKFIVIPFLIYTLYLNIEQTNKFSNSFSINIFNIDIWSPVATNVLCSYLFSLFIVILIISVFRKL